MTWWLWLIIGLITGFTLAAICIAAGSYVITHNNRLMAWFSARIVRTMVQGTQKEAVKK